MEQFGGQAPRRSSGRARTVAPRWPVPGWLVVLAGAGGEDGVGLALQVLHDGGVAERRRVAEVVALGDVLQEPAHDLARARLRQVVDEDHGLRPRDLADLLADPLPQLRGQLV